MELTDLSASYLAVAGLAWAWVFVWLVRHPEWIAASVLAVIFFMPAAVDLLLGGRSIPTGQLVVLFFLPPLLTSITLHRRPVNFGDLSALLVYGGCVLLGIFVNRVPFWEYKSALVPTLVALIVYLGARSRHALRRLFVVYVLFIFVNVAVAGLQRSGFDWAYLPSQLENAIAGGLRRGIGLSSHFSNAAFYAAITVPVATVLFLVARQNLHRAIALAVGAVGLAGITFSVSRAALLGAMLGVFTVLWRNRSWQALRLVMTLAVLVAAVVVVVPPLRNAGEDLVMHSTRLDDSARARPQLAKMGLDTWAQSPILGGGPDAVDRYVGHRADPHNTFANVLAETGLIGLGFFLWVLIRSYRRAKAAILRGHVKEGTALLGALFATIPVAVFHSLNYIDIFWVLLALCLAAGALPPVGSGRPARGTRATCIRHT